MILVRAWDLIFILLVLTFSLSIKAANFNKAKPNSGLIYELQTKNDIDQLITKSRGKPAPGPWHFNNLYDESSNSFFIPTTCGLVLSGTVISQQIIVSIRLNPCGNLLTLKAGREKVKF